MKTTASVKVREKVLSLVERGWETERILKKYPELTRQQISAYKAHRTMGRY